MEERHKTGGGCAACRVLAVLNACSRRRDLARFGRWKGTPADCRAWGGGEIGRLGLSEANRRIGAGSRRTGQTDSKSPQGANLPI